MPTDITTTGRATEHPKIETLTDRINKPLEAIYRALDLTDDPVVSVLLTDDDEIESLNERWRGIDKPTDVLSFPAHHPDQIPDRPTHLGDIAISVDYADRLVSSGEHRRRVAKQLACNPDKLDWRLEDEVAFLFVHGLLHLVGYDHADPEEERQMRQMERQLWELTND